MDAVAQDTELDGNKWFMACASVEATTQVKSSKKHCSDTELINLECLVKFISTINITGKN